MQDFETKRLPVERDSIATDGSDVRVLLNLQDGGTEIPSILVTWFKINWFQAQTLTSTRLYYEGGLR